jgi:hypothetical protein
LPLRPAARLVAVAGAVLMPVSLFLHWYEVAEGATGDNAKITIKGWDAFESTDALMTLAAVAAIALVVAVPRYAGRTLLGLGGVAAGWIVVQLIDGPPLFGAFVDRSDISLEIGAWLGLLGALLIVAAGGTAARTAPRSP